MPSAASLTKLQRAVLACWLVACLLIPANLLDPPEPGSCRAGSGNISYLSALASGEALFLSNGLRPRPADGLNGPLKVALMPRRVPARPGGAVSPPFAAFGAHVALTAVHATVAARAPPRHS
jgi:hypothetical protein